jgi:hypothetical protein
MHHVTARISMPPNALPYPLYFRTVVLEVLNRDDLNGYGHFLSSNSRLLLPGRYTITMIRTLGPVERECDDKKSTLHDTLKYSLLGPSLTKAGQDAVDQQKV